MTKDSVSTDIPKPFAQRLTNLLTLELHTLHFEGNENAEHTKGKVFNKITLY